MGSQHWCFERSHGCEPIGTWHVDVNELRPKLDASMSVLYGIDPSEGAQGISPSQLLRRIHPEDRAEARTGLMSAIKEAGPYLYRYRLLQADDAYHWVQASGRCFTDETGRPTHVAGILVEDGDAPALPVEVCVIDLLMRSHELAKATSDTSLPRLIEAVLLHAGRELAKSVGPTSLTRQEHFRLGDRRC